MPCTAARRLRNSRAALKAQPVRGMEAPMQSKDGQALGWTVVLRR
jgi:hypothetical protein